MCLFNNSRYAWGMGAWGKGRIINIIIIIRNHKLLISLSST